MYLLLNKVYWKFIYVYVYSSSKAIYRNLSLQNNHKYWKDYKQEYIL